MGDGIGRPLDPRRRRSASPKLVRAPRVLPAPADRGRSPGVQRPHGRLGAGHDRECKLAAGLGALGQLDGYLRQSRQNTQRWRGHLIVADVYTAQLAEAVFEREDVQLWICDRTEAGRPQLVEGAKADPRAPLQLRGTSA